jgi:nitroreductase/dihydropteridine reductase
MQTRYATKVFDQNKTICDEDLVQLLNVLHLAPSSVNTQPWHFIVASTEAGKARVNQGATGAYAPKVTACSHVIVMCSKIHMDNQYLAELLEQEEQDGRFTSNPDFKDTYHKVRSTFVDLHRFELKDTQHWMEKQVYLNLGALLTSAAAMNIDALPMEGFDFPALDREFSLREQNLAPIAVVALGYRSTEDFNANLPKSRLPKTQIFTHI